MLTCRLTCMPLHALPALVSMTVVCCRQPDAGQICRLTALSMLQDCSLSHSWTPGRVRSELANLPSLSCLALSQYQPHRGNTRLQEFGELPALVNLRLSFDCDEPVNIYVHSSLSRLEKLYLGDPVIADIHCVGAWVLYSAPGLMVAAAYELCSLLAPGQLVSTGALSMLAGSHLQANLLFWIS